MYDPNNNITMLYKIISWIRLPCSEVGIVWKDVRGILVALDEHPLVASGGQVRGRGVSVLLPVRAHAGDTCDLPVRVDGWEQWEGPLYRRLEKSWSPGTNPE